MKLLCKKIIHTGCGASGEININVKGSGQECPLHTSKIAS
jgi:hypothetical protein